MYNKTTSPSFFKYGEPILDKSILHTGEFEYQEIVENEKTLIDLYKYNSDVYIQRMEGIAMLCVCEDLETDSIHSFVLHRTIRLNANLLFNIIPMTKDVRYNVFTKKGSDVVTTRLSTPYNIHHIKITFNVEEIYSYYYNVKSKGYAFDGEEHNYFEYPQDSIKFFKQENLPLLTEDKKILIGKNKLIKEAADGNGGIFYSMHKNKILKDMKKKGIKWIFISSIDNLLLKIADTTLIGLAIERNTQIATKSIIRNSPEEKVGAICKKNKKIKVVEYSEMSDEMKSKTNEDGELKYGESHIMCNLFSLKSLNILAKKKLPYHIAHKKSDYIDNNGSLIKSEKPNVYKFETFIFDGWTYFNDIAVLRGKREEDFAPIKNKEGVDSPETAIELYNNFIKGEQKI